jgi:hypothetical protein
MDTDIKNVKNPEYLWIFRIGIWATLLITIPLFFIDTYANGSALSNTLTLLFHCYLVVAGYIFGYRLDNPPKWARWVVRAKWLDEWRYLVHADPESIKSNRMGLLRIIGAATLLTILLLAFLSGKL